MSSTTWLIDGPEPLERLARAPMYRERRQSLTSMLLTQCRPSSNRRSRMNRSCASVSWGSTSGTGPVAMAYTAKKTEGS